ncbi:MAG: hypothetical protein KKC75_06945 [Nanoarchaeota archaeon]|nr:hypothetical protein [Nanoarchaeota archaeon]MBU1005782.1 hypothetical protein [Nanoarchaeota archaeon]MBU1946925.1 hypothetical protein [Nanoarchaeota archaeon]
MAKEGIAKDVYLPREGAKLEVGKTVKTVFEIKRRHFENVPDDGYPETASDGSLQRRKRLYKHLEILERFDYEQDGEGLDRPNHPFSKGNDRANRPVTDVGSNVAQYTNYTMRNRFNCGLLREAQEIIDHQSKSRGETDISLIVDPSSIRITETGRGRCQDVGDMLKYSATADIYVAKKAA